LKVHDTIALVWFAVINAVTWLAFAFDKWRATRSGWRVPESTLAMLGALGGWPGGLLGMMMFHHTTSKWTFKLKYALALVPFVVEVWAWWRYR
jgi:uncharacterized membrane protein YsdA (DUF1294 family)